MEISNFLNMEDDTFNIVLMYISNSDRNIIFNKQDIFSGIFCNLIHIIYKIPTLKKLYATFFIEFWGLLEIQIHKKLILQVFLNYEYFRKGMLHLSLAHDDVELFDLCLIADKFDFIKLTDKINKYMAWDIFLHSVKYKTYLMNNVIPDRFRTLNILLDCSQNKQSELELLSSLATQNVYISHNLWLFSDVLSYYTFHINQQYVQTELDKYISNKVGSKYYFNTNTRNTLKFILKQNDKLTDLNIHQFLLTHHNLSLVFEYFTNPYFLESGFSSYVLDVLEYKMLRNKNIINTLFQHKYLITNLYELDRNMVFKYFTENYDKLQAAQVKFIMGTVFSKSHCKDFYEIVSKSRKGNLSKKDRKQIYNTVKPQKLSLAPRLPSIPSIPSIPRI
jgi:hypothetical protein